MSYSFSCWTVLIRPLNVLTVRAELVEAQAAFRQAQGERILKLHEAGSIKFVNMSRSGPCPR